MTEAIKIRLMQEDDLDLVLAWRNHPDIRRYMLTSHEIGMDEHRQWFARVSQDTSKCILIVQDDEIPLGLVQFSGVTPGGIADWGFYAAPGAKKGSGRKLGHTALMYGFKTLKLHKICGQALAFNDASIRFHKMFLFKQEGVFREHHRIDGTYHDMICFGLLSNEWLEK